MITGGVRSRLENSGRFLGSVIGGTQVNGGEVIAGQRQSSPSVPKLDAIKTK